jgi:hypothetical protein
MKRAVAAAEGPSSERGCWHCYSPRGAALWPAHAHFFPPTVLLMVILLATFYSVMVWRTEWIGSKLFPGQTLPVVRRHDRFIAVIGLMLSVLLTGIWIRSVLAT